MSEFVENVRRILEAAFGIVLSKNYEIVGYHQNLFNFPQADDIMPLSVQNLQPPHAEHVVREDKVILKEVTDA